MNHLSLIGALLAGMLLGWGGHFFITTRINRYLEAVSCANQVCRVVSYARQLRAGEVDKVIRQLERELTAGLAILDDNEDLLRSHPELTRARERGASYITEMGGKSRD